MSLDKDDLLRNAVPGYVFLVVILSFYALTSRLDEIQATPHAIMGLVAGFPIGLIFQTLYREIFHIWAGEQRRIVREETQVVPPDIKEKLFNKIQWTGKQADKKWQEEILQPWLAISLNKEENRPFRERTNFLMSYAHALGATCLAIAIALIVMLFFKIQYFGLNLCCPESMSAVSVSGMSGISLNFLCPIFSFALLCKIYCQNPAWHLCLSSAGSYADGLRLAQFFVCFLAWIFVAIIVFLGRERVIRKAYQISRKLFISQAKLDEDKSWLLIVNSRSEGEI